MATREEVKKIMLMIANEYPDFIPENKEMASFKITTWFKVLEEYKAYELQVATKELLVTHTYGTPKIGHLMTILQPVVKETNEGIEFATRLIDLNKSIGVNQKSHVERRDGELYLVASRNGDLLGEKVMDEFGKIGYSVYRQVKNELRLLNLEDVHTFKAQVRTLYNSYKEKEDHGLLEKLPYKQEAQKLIDNDMKRLETLRRVGECETAHTRGESKAQGINRLESGKDRPNVVKISQNEK